MREFSVPPKVTIGEPADLTDPVWDNARTHPDAPLFARPTPEGWADVSCARFRDEVVALARGLAAAGVSPGARVALMSRTRYEWTLVDYAIWACGAITVPIYETSSAEQVEWILADAGAVGCVVETGAHALLLAGLRERLPELANAWQIDVGDLDGLVAAGAAVDASVIDKRRADLRSDDIATIIYTSGTTGRPKGCLLTHRNLLSDISNALPELDNLFHREASTLLFLPLAHSFARLIQIGCVQARAKLGHTADVKNLTAELQRFRPTFVLAVPRVFEKIYNAARQRAHADGKGAIFDRAQRVAVAHSRARDTDGGPGLVLRAQHALFERLVYRRLRAALGGRCGAAISGGAPLGTWLGHFYRGIGVTVQEGYGLTETSPALTVNTHDAMKIGTVGRPLPGVTLRIDDDGEILVQGDVVFRGYWRNDEATGEVIDAGGWFHTGDLGELDADGFLRITGRKKELIVTAAGKNVAPAVLEDGVRAHPLVSQCVVVGDRQPFIAALVTIDEDALPGWLRSRGRPAGTAVAELTDDPQLREEIQAAVDAANEAVSRAESIREFRILPADFSEASGELTPSLKIKRGVVHKTYSEQIAEIYAR